MTKIDNTEDRVDAVISDGVYSPHEHDQLRVAFSDLGLREKLALLRRIDETMESMPGGGDHGAWSALLRVQTHLRQLAAGAKAPPPLPLDFVDAKKLTRKYAHDGKLDDDERRTLKRLLVRMSPRFVERLRSFAARREEFAFVPLRKTGFGKVRGFIEEHAEAGSWKQVDVDEAVK